MDMEMANGDEQAKGMSGIIIAGRRPMWGKRKPGVSDASHTLVSDQCITQQVDGLPCVVFEAYQFGAQDWNQYRYQMRTRFTENWGKRFQLHGVIIQRTFRKLIRPV
jgi:hypothetical protein